MENVLLSQIISFFVWHATLQFALFFGRKCSRRVNDGRLLIHSHFHCVFVLFKIVILLWDICEKVSGWHIICMTNIKYIYFFINNNNNYDIVDVYFGRTQSTQNNRDSISSYYLHNWQCLLLARGAGGRTRPIGNIPPQIVQPTIIIARVYIAAIVSRRWELCNTPYVLKSELFVAGRCAEAAQRTRAKEEKKSVLNYYERDSHRRSPLCARYLPMLPNFIPFFTHTSFPRHVARLVSVQSFDILHAAPLCTPGKLLYVFLSHSLS